MIIFAKVVQLDELGKPGKYFVVNFVTILEKVHQTDTLTRLMISSA
jgi:hypothetical protein